MDERNPRSNDDAFEKTSDEPDINRTNEDDLIGAEDEEFEDVDEVDEEDTEEDVEE